MSLVPSSHVLEIRVPVIESEREFLRLVVEAAVRQYRLYRRGRVSDDPGNRSEHSNSGTCRVAEASGGLRNDGNSIK